LKISLTWTILLEAIVGRTFDMGKGYGLDLSIWPYWNVVKPEDISERQKMSEKICSNFLLRNANILNKTTKTFLIVRQKMKGQKLRY